MTLLLVLALWCPWGTQGKTGELLETSLQVPNTGQLLS